MRRQFYKFAGQKCAKSAKCLFHLVETALFIQSVEDTPLFHLLKTLWKVCKTCFVMAFPLFPQSFQQPLWRNFPHNSPDKPRCQSGIMPILAAYPPRSLTEFTNLPQIPQVLPLVTKVHPPQRKNLLIFCQSSGYNKLDDAPDLGTSTTDTFYVEV